MEKLTQELKNLLKGKRNCKKEICKLVGTIYRGIENNNFTFEDAEKYLIEGGNI